MTAALQLVMEANSKLLTSAKVANPRGCSIDIDKLIHKPVLIMKGSTSQTRVRIPREDRPLSSLRLHDSLLVAQISLNSMEHFALEVVVSQYTVSRTKLVIGTHIRAARFDQNAEDLTTAYLPLIIPRNKWVQVVFHIAGIAHSVFNLPSITCIDTITLTGTARMCCVFTSSDEQSCIDATPDGMALFAVPAYAPPIWKTAISTPDHSSIPLPVLEARNASPVVGELPSISASATASESPPPIASPLSKHQAMPPRLEPIRDVVATPPSPKGPSSSNSAVPMAALPLAKAPVRSPPRCEYIRLVDDDDLATRSELAAVSSSYPETHRQTLSNQDGGNGRVYGGTRGGGGGVDAAGGGLGGWENPPDERPGAGSASPPPRNGKAEALKKPMQRKPRSGPGLPGPPGAGDNERLQRIIASRKRRVAPRQGSVSGGGDSGRGTGSRRQQRLRRRMRAMRANEQKVNKAAAAKGLLASELPLSERISLAEEAVEAAPVCGYGFGYLGVLKPNGEYEEDEDANLRLAGALTLLTDGE